MFLRVKPNRCINTQTQRPDLFQNINPDMRMSGKLWRLTQPVYVDYRGVITNMRGIALDISIQNQIIVTADEWREANKKTPTGEREIYVDHVTGLPAVDPKTGELLATHGSIARSKIICGEWIRIKYFMQYHGRTVFVDIRTNEPTQLIGSALFKAVEDGSIVGINMKIRARDTIINRHSEPSLREPSGISSSNLFFTPPVPREKAEIVPASKKIKRESSESTDNKLKSVITREEHSTYDLTDQELLDLLTSIPQLPVVPDFSEDPLNHLDESIDEIVGLKPNTHS